MKADAPIDADIYEVPRAIRETVDGVSQSVSAVAELIRQRQTRRIFFIGNGTSLYAGIAASHTARALAPSDGPLVVAVPAGDFRHYMPKVDQHDVVVGLSASGEFRDVIAVFEQLRGRTGLVGITHVPGSTLERVADLTLVTRGGDVASAVANKTYSSTLVAAHALMLRVFDAPDDVERGLLSTADHAQRAIESAEEFCSASLPQLAGRHSGYVFGAGSGYAASLEAALKFKEISGLHVEGGETSEVSSGPATVVGPEDLCVALLTTGVGGQMTANLADHVATWGAQVIRIGPMSPEAGGLKVRLDLPLFEPFASLVLVPPVALIAYRLAVASGVNPDAPAWRERYVAQGMEHLMGSVLPATAS